MYFVCSVIREIASRATKTLKRTCVTFVEGVKLCKEAFQKSLHLLPSFVEVKVNCIVHFKDSLSESEFVTETGCNCSLEALFH